MIAAFVLLAIGVARLLDPRGGTVLPFAIAACALCGVFAVMIVRNRGTH